MLNKLGNKERTHQLLLKVSSAQVEGRHSDPLGCISSLGHQLLIKLPRTGDNTHLYHKYLYYHGFHFSADDLQLTCGIIIIKLSLINKFNYIYMGDV